MALQNRIFSIITNSAIIGLAGCVSQPMQQQMQINLEIREKHSIIAEDEPQYVSWSSSHTAKPRLVAQGTAYGKVGAFLTTDAMPAVGINSAVVVEYDSFKSIKRTNDYVLEPEWLTKERWTKIMSPSIISEERENPAKVDVTRFIPESDSVYLIRGSTLYNSLNQVRDATVGQIDQMIIDLRGEGLFDRPLTGSHLLDKTNVWINADDLKIKFPKGSLKTSGLRKTKVILSMPYSGRIRIGERTTVAQVLADALDRPVLASSGPVYLTEDNLHPIALRESHTGKNLHFVIPRDHYLHGNFYLVHPTK